MRILLLTRYMRTGASSRVRFYQYLPYLQSQGIEVQVEPFFGDDYIKCLNSGENIPISMAIKSYIKRIGSLFRAGSFDLIWLEKEIFPWLPALAEQLLAVFSIPYVVDYDDAVFHRYDQHQNPLVKALLGNKIDKIMRNAALVVVGNEYLEQHARNAGARRVEYLPSVVDQNRWKPKVPSECGYHIGWIGSPTATPFLGTILKPLEKLCQDPKTSVTLIGSGWVDYLPGIRKQILPWIEEKEVSDVSNFDVGIMPLIDGPFERGKCGYKLIEYMACGLPVVASPVGVNKQIVEDGVTGYLVSTDVEWYHRLDQLCKDVALRQRMGAAGRRKMEEKYSLQVTSPQLLKLLTSV